MKAGLALLADRTVANTVSRLAWDIHVGWQIGVAARCYPAHISLKQPFELGDRLADMQAYTEHFASSLAPQPITLGALFAWDNVLGIDVHETPALRALHNRLNRDLPPLFGDVRADHDGDEYHFHMTIAMGGADAATYAAVHAACASLPLPAAFTATELGLFTGYQLSTGGWQYMLHTIYPLSGDL